MTDKFTLYMLQVVIDFNSFRRLPDDGIGILIKLCRAHFVSEGKPIPGKPSYNDTNADGCLAIGIVVIIPEMKED